MILAKLVDILQKSNFNKPLLTILHGSPLGRRSEAEFLVLCVRRRRRRHTHTYTHTHTTYGEYGFSNLLIVQIVQTRIDSFKGQFRHVNIMIEFISPE